MANSKKKEEELWKEELSTWWNDQTQTIRKQVLKNARFHSADIATYGMAKKTIQELSDAGWGVEVILSSRLRLGYYS